MTHTDLDGVAAAAVYLRLLRVPPDDAKVVLTEPYNLHKVLRDIAKGKTTYQQVVLADLGINDDVVQQVRELLSDIRSKGSEIEWYDHHVWSDRWLQALRSTGAHIVIDTSSCATGVVYTHAAKLHHIDPPEELEELVNAVCAADLWRWDHPLAPKLFRIIGRGENGPRTGWKLRVLRKFYNGVLWDKELQAALERYVDLELKGYSKLTKHLRTMVVNGVSLAVTFKPPGPPSNSMAAAFVAGRTGAEIVVVVRRDGAISLRSAECDVRKLALALGGGGHPKASGAKVRAGLFIRLLGRVFPGLLLSRAAKSVEEALRRVGCKPAGGGQAESAWQA